MDIVSNRFCRIENKIRGYMFYPHGEQLKEGTLDKNLRNKKIDIRQSAPYTRIQTAIQNFRSLSLAFERSFMKIDRRASFFKESVSWYFFDNRVQHFSPF